MTERIDKVIRKSKKVPPFSIFADAWKFRLREEAWRSLRDGKETTLEFNNAKIGENYYVKEKLFFIEVLFVLKVNYDRQD